MIEMIMIRQYWHAPGFTSFAKHSCDRYIICLINNIARGISVATSAHPRPEGQFEHLMMDFIELSPCQGCKYCLVVIDMFSKWVEAFPCRAANANTGAKCLLRKIIPKWGLASK